MSSNGASGISHTIIFLDLYDREKIASGDVNRLRLTLSLRAVEMISSIYFCVFSIPKTSNSGESVIPSTIIPPFVFANADYVSQKLLGTPLVAVFTSNVMFSPANNNLSKSCAVIFIEPPAIIE